MTDVDHAEFLALTDAVKGPLYSYGEKGFARSWRGPFHTPAAVTGILKHDFVKREIRNTRRGLVATPRGIAIGGTYNGTPGR
jgi:hypothetical protein